MKGMPDEFYLPRPQDFCRGDFTKGECGEKHCFVGWQRELFPLPSFWSISTPDEREALKHFFKVALRVAKRMKLKAGEGKPIDGQILDASWTCFDYNDDTRNTPKQLAKWFEETVKELGYAIS